MGSDTCSAVLQLSSDACDLAFSGRGEDTFIVALQELLPGVSTLSQGLETLVDPPQA